MLRLSRYVKRYLPIVLLAVLLLFGQALLDLNLPNMMSNIVDVGIRKGGIEELAPKAVNTESLLFLERFMSAEDVETVTNAYTLYEDLDAAAQEQVDKTFPGARAANAMVLTAEGDARAAADEAVSRGGYAFIDIMQEVAQQQGIEVGSGDENTANFDLDTLQQLMPFLMQLPQQQIDEVVQRAAVAPDTMTHQVAAALNRAFYTQLGADMSRMQMRYIFRVGGIMVLLSVAMVICAVCAGYCFARMGAGVARDIRGDIFKKVNAFSNAEIDKFSTSSLITRTTNDVTQVQMMYTMGLRMLVFAPLMGVGGIVMALRKSPGMSWIIAVAVGIIILVIGLLFVLVMPRFKRMQKLLDRLNMVARENLSGIMVVRAFSNQKFQEQRFEKANRNYTQNSLFVGRAMVSMMPVMMLVMNGVSLFIVWLGADQIAQSAIQVGDLMAFIQYSMQVIMSFLFIAMIFVLVPRASVSAERIDEVLRSESSVKDPQNPVTLGHKAKGEVAFHDVSFCYDGADEDVLHHITFTAKPGQTTAFIGSTGSGKSTLINLIPRFYDVTEGSITLDGVDIRKLSQHELRDNIGYVPQKGLLFSGDITSNLRYGNQKAGSATLREAAEIAQATEFINRLDDGFKSHISQGGTNVSGGQRQRLAIARALVKNAPVYIFDDSFSALDFATDARLRAALKPYTQNAAVLIVAQRVSSIMHAEQIVVLEAGRMVGIGTHEELLKSSKAYREIAESQLSKEELA